MPGHKGKNLPYPLPIGADLTELPDTDDLYFPTGAIARAQSLAARSAHAAHTICLTNGSTAGVMTMIAHSVPRGGRLIASANAHRSVSNSCELFGLNRIDVELRHRSDGLLIPDANAWLAAIRNNPQANAVLVTSPDYYGLATPLDAIAAEAHRLGMRLLVDQAHGAHWNWWDNPSCAGLNGADMWVQSAHKTLPCPGQTAWLHLSSTEDAEKVRAKLAMMQTSSPSYLFMTALDSVRAWMDEHGADALARLLKMIPAEWPDGIFDPRMNSGQSHDPTRIVLDVTGRGLNGFDAQKRLAEQGIDIELADERRIILIASVADEPGDYVKLLDALRSL
jgi:arginine/lysine/ornithine decarboxylase